MAETAQTDPYVLAFQGGFTSTLRWPQLDALWERLRDSPSGWFLYAVGEEPPSQPSGEPDFLHFLEEIDALLRREHNEDYCGIVYADSLQQPTMVKIYDPNNLGVSCGYSDNPPLPGWVISRLKPADLHATRQAAGRRRWWQRVFAPRDQ